MICLEYHRLCYNYICIEWSINNNNIVLCCFIIMNIITQVMNIVTVWVCPPATPIFENIAYSKLSGKIN